MGTQNMDDLGKVRGKTRRKAWHIGENPLHGKADFYPLLAKMGKDIRGVQLVRCLLDRAGDAGHGHPPRYHLFPLMRLDLPNRQPFALAFLISPI
jgi:hypothetical protein